MSQANDNKLPAMLGRTAQCIDYFNEHQKWPSSHSGPLGGWLHNMRAAKKGTGKSTWYPDCEQLAIERGHPTLFGDNQLVTNAVVLARTNQCIDYFNEHQKWPGRRVGLLGGWLHNMRIAKKGTNKCKWHPACEQLADARGYPTMFDAQRRTK